MFRKQAGIERKDYQVTAEQTLKQVQRDSARRESDRVKMVSPIEPRDVFPNWFRKLYGSKVQTKHNG
ncbi:MAG: hypothetical protein CMI36_02550 [Owenweeksia sp.]|nr:hypothetical protein [Owenweeksia sp.]MBF97846.1 hypothetical protein [Owenweeksia sp.]HCQ16881.1 hypothetical protein [Cryomorphaceae bacterium]